MSLGQSATGAVSLANNGSTAIQVSQLAVTGQPFSIVSQPALPASVAAGSSLSLTVKFNPTSAGNTTGSLSVASNASNGNLGISLSGIGTPAAGTLSALSCNSGSVTGAGADACTVTLSAPALESGVTVHLTSNNTAVAVPASVTVPTGATSASFQATVSAVASAQTATLTASAAGVSQSYSLQLGSEVAELTVGMNSLSFGNVDLNTPMSHSITLTSSGTAPLTISAASLTGKGFGISGLKLPVVLNPGQTATLQVSFEPTSAGVASGSLTISSNAVNATTAIALSGTGEPAAGTLDGLSCAIESITGAGADTCTVSLSAPAIDGGLEISLASSNSAVKVPATVTIKAGATSATFAAAVAAVSTAETATMTASAAGISRSYALKLGAAVPQLTIGPASLSFGNVTENTTATASVTLISAGTAPLTISNVTVTGTEFGMTAPSLPMTLDPGKTAELTVKFDPASTGAASGTVTISSNAATAKVGLSGTGTEATGALNSLACSSSSIIGAGTDACVVKLAAAAPAGGLSLNLASSSSAVKVPSTVTAVAGATSTSFAASVSAVSSTQAATLSASSGGFMKSFVIELKAVTPTLTLSTTSLAFGDVTVNTPTTKAVTLKSSGTAALTISSAGLAGAGFSVSGASFPLTLQPGNKATLEVEFDPASSGAVTGTLKLTSNAASEVIALSGTGELPTELSGLSCSSASATGTAADSCTVLLSAAAPAGGMSISLASSRSAVKVPSTVTVAAGATSTSFAATISAVSSAETVTLTATSGGITKSYTLRLNGVTPALTLGTTSVAFGPVNLNTTATQSITLRSSGTAPLIISKATLTGTGFTMSGLSLPLTLQPGQTATLNVAFDPTAAGAATGSLAVTSNASSGATQTISLSGTGSAASYAVKLNWDAPSNSAQPIAGYNIYRAQVGQGSYVLLNSSPISTTSYTDSSVASGTDYSYEVMSVDSKGVQSSPSNPFTVDIP